ncbi:MAG: type II CAAX endopeptidase family protein [Vagococcus sp.]
MSINKNTIWTIFGFLCALQSPLLFSILPFIPKTAIPNLTAIMYVLGAVVLSMINLKTNKEATLSREKDDYGLIISLGLVSIIGSFFLQSILAMIEIVVFNQPMGSQNTADITAIIKSSPFFIIAVTIAGPIMEEFVFRFSLINWLNQKLNIWLSAIISSALFAVMHVDGHYLVYGGLGFLFFLIYRKTGSILTSIIAHAGMNTLVIVLQLLFVK